MNDQANIPEGPGREPGSSLGESLDVATERIEVIVTAAERAAAGIIADAEAQARRYLDKSRAESDRAAAERARALATVTDRLVADAEEIKRRLEALIGALEDAARDAGEGADPPEPEPAETLPFPRLKPVEAPQASGQAPALQEAAPARPATFARRPEPAASAAASAPARLLATQMAVAGNSRPEIENRLRSEFGIDDAGPMLDAILGPES